MNSIKFGDIEISDSLPPLVVPEIGINHGGSLELACLMVDSAARAGARVVKHQTHVVEDEMSKAARNVIPGNSSDSIYEIMSKCALSFYDERRLKEYAESKGMVYFSTPFSRVAANRLADLGLEIYKIGSGECNNYPLIKHIASFGKPMIVSTGMNSIESIAPTVKIMTDANIPFVLLHTTNLYPTPPHLVRLEAMSVLAKEFGCLVGLSDHTTSNLACLGATALGAVVLERHFTDVMTRTGPDIVCSMDENSLAELINLSAQMHSMRKIAYGGGQKQAVEEEQVTIDFAFASVTSISDIKSGEVLNESNIWVKRPGKGGIPAKYYDLILGKIAVRDISVDTQLTWEDFR